MGSGTGDAYQNAKGKPFPLSRIKSFRLQYDAIESRKNFTKHTKNQQESFAETKRSNLRMKNGYHRMVPAARLAGHDTSCTQAGRATVRLNRQRTLLRSVKDIPFARKIPRTIIASFLRSMPLHMCSLSSTFDFCLSFLARAFRSPFCFFYLFYRRSTLTGVR